MQDFVGEILFRRNVHKDVDQKSMLRNRWSGGFVALAFFALVASFNSMATAGTSRPAGDAPHGVAPPKLVVIVVVDGLPQEQLLKNYDLFPPGGFRRLMDKGAWFSDAHQGHAFTVTAVGHAAVVTGAYPYQHGLIANEWRDREGKYMYSVGDDAHAYLDGFPTGAGEGTSPRNLQVSTIGDELKYATSNLARVFAVAGKDRASIVLAGKTGTAYVYRSKTGSFSSSSYYMKAHPAWVTQYVANKPADKYFKQVWTPSVKSEAYQRSTADDHAYFTSDEKLPARFGTFVGLAMDAPNEIFYGQLQSSPFGDELTADFTRALLVNEGLGKNPAGVTDVLGVGFSSHDSINHRFGPASAQSQDHLLRLDRILEKLFRDVDRQVGKGNALIVLTADHGFMDIPELSTARQFDAGRIDSGELRDTASKALEERFGVPKLVKQFMTGGVTLDYAAAEAKGVTREALEQAAMRAVLAFPGINYVFTRTQLETGSMPATRVGKLVTRAWNRHAAIDLAVVQKPFYYFQSRSSKSLTVCSHGTPYSYDTNVPLMIEGAKWVQQGRYTTPAEVVDIASTLSAILHVRSPSAAEGRVLSEALAGQHIQH